MKKILLNLFLASSFAASAQVLQTENFNALTVGNVGTDITGATAGQGSWLTISDNGAAPTTTTNAGNANFQIVTNGNSSTNGVAIQSPNGDKGVRFMWKDGLPEAWTARTTGNNVIDVEFDFFTGPVTTSKAQTRVALLGLEGTTARTLNGFIYTMDTRVLRGLCYLDNAGTLGTYTIPLPATGDFVLSSDTWYRMGFSYNTSTGETIWKVGNIYTGLPAANWAGPFDPVRLQFYSYTQAAPNTNTLSSSVIYDNYVVTARATEALLNIEQVSLNENAFSIYPNPSNGIFNIDVLNGQIINKVEVSDINGRVINTMFGNQYLVDISECSKGVYLMKISTENGSVTKKIIKE